MFEPFIAFFIFFSCIGTGLMAGLFFSFSTFIMAALGKVPAKEGMEAMKSINRTILNPLFGFVFFGTALVSLFLLVVSLFHPAWNGRMYILFGSALYLTGIVLITLFVNVPLNNQLEKSDSTMPSSSQVWTDYLKNWTLWNHLRTLTAVGALACFILGFKHFH